MWEKSAQDIQPGRAGAAAPAGAGPESLAGVSAPPGAGPVRLSGARGPAGVNPGPRKTLHNTQATDQPAYMSVFI